ncbi:MAG TPA: argininosuccinate lyase [Halanaerobiales bacterium]|nr:argininosuccinate lyase [Halanaerobiales bacterium]
MKLWGGRFDKNTTLRMDKFNSSLPFDIRLLPYDIQGSIVHVKMLAKQNIIKGEEKEAIIKGLKEIEAELEEDISNNKFDYYEAEDIHSLIEKRLTGKIGSTAGKMHTGRSRNDQVNLDLKLYLNEITEKIKELLLNLMEILVDMAENNHDVIMPGYTHLQRAQPITFGHHILAYFYKFKRDLERLEDYTTRLNISPLGSGALAGSNFNLDQEFTAEQLGFAGIYENSIDGVSDRDYVLEFEYIAANIMIHFSNISEEIIIWNTSEFSFIELSDEYTTGSSIMPQKKNPDLAELTRGKSGRVFGNLMQMLTVMKGLPLAYNKDLQEDKEGLFDTCDTILRILEVYPDMLKTMRINKEKLKEVVENDYLIATDLADYLTSKDIPFRKAHELVGEIVKYAEDNKKNLKQLKFAEYNNILGQYHEYIDKDIYKLFDLEESISSKKTAGGPSNKRVKEQIRQARNFINIK